VCFSVFGLSAQNILKKNICYLNFSHLNFWNFFSPEKIQEVKPELFELLNFFDLFPFTIHFFTKRKTFKKKVQKFKKFKKSSWNIFSEEKKIKKFNKSSWNIFSLGKN